MLNIIYIYVYTHYYTFIYFGDYTPSLSLFLSIAVKVSFGLLSGCFFCQGDGITSPSSRNPRPHLSKFGPSQRIFLSKPLCERWWQGWEIPN